MIVVSADRPIQLGGRHCCVCVAICHHIGPMQLCDLHGQRRLVIPEPSAGDDSAAGAAAATA